MDETHQKNMSWQVIIFSTVRCNKEGRLGFVTDPRRMNVAITRAKRGLIVIGSSATLSSNKCWSSWLQHIERQHLMVDSNVLL